LNEEKDLYKPGAVGARIGSHFKAKGEKKGKDAVSRGEYKRPVRYGKVHGKKEKIAASYTISVISFRPKGKRPHAREEFFSWLNVGGRLRAAPRKTTKKKIK